jgi:hypothetical protein
VQGGYGALFAVQVQIFFSITSVAVQAVLEPENCHDAGFILRADARFDSRNFSEGWCPGAYIITNLS